MLKTRIGKQIVDFNPGVGSRVWIYALEAGKRSGINNAQSDDEIASLSQKFLRRLYAGDISETCALAVNASWRCNVALSIPIEQLLPLQASASLCTGRSAASASLVRKRPCASASLCRKHPCAFASLGSRRSPAFASLDKGRPAAFACAGKKGEAASASVC